MKRILYSAIITLFVTFLGTGALHAISPTAQPTPTQGLSITPPSFELTANPGDTTSKNSIRVDNISTSPLHVTVGIKNFVALGEEGQVGLTEEDSTYSLASWIKLDQQEATIPVKGSQTFTFTVQVPPNAEPGGRFGSILFKTEIPSYTGGSAVGQELGALVLMRIAGQVKEQADIEEFMPTKSFWEYGPITFKTRIQNSGNVHIKPTGTITIIDLFGKKVDTISVDSKNVLPGATRKIDSTWQKRSLFGKYTATVSLQYGNNQQIITSSSSFTVIPVRVVLFWLVIIAVIVTLLYLGRERTKRALRVLLGKD